MSETEEMHYVERVEHWGDRIPQGYIDEYHKLLNGGRAPHIAAAVVAYVEAVKDPDRRVTQEEIAEKYNISTVTIREYYGEIAPELDSTNLSKTADDAQTQKQPTKPTAARKICYVLYSAENEKLSTKTIRDRLPFAYGTVSSNLRMLLDEKIVGGQVVGGEKKWWFVPRGDTPAFSNRDARASDVSPDEVVKKIASERAWKEKETYRKDQSAHYSISRKGSPNITQTGWEDLTGETEVQKQLQVLESEYDIDVADDLTVSINTNQSGLRKILRGVSEENMR